MAGDVDNIIGTAGDGDVAVFINNRTVSREVDRFAIFDCITEVGFFEALWIAPNGADHARPRFGDAHEPLLAHFGFGAVGVDHLGFDARQREGGARWLDRGGSGQWADHVSASLSLPPRIDDRAATAPDRFVVPFPSRRIDRLTDGSQNSQAAEIVFGRLILPHFVEQTDRGGGGVELIDLVLFDHLPCPSSIGEGHHSFEHYRRGTRRKRAVDDVRMSGDPAYIGGTPEGIIILHVKHPLHRHLCPEDVPSSAVLDTLGFASASRRVEEEERVLSLDDFRLTLYRFVFDQLIVGVVASRLPVDLLAVALDDADSLDTLAATLKGFVDDGLEHVGLALTESAISGDHQFGFGIDDPIP